MLRRPTTCTCAAAVAVTAVAASLFDPTPARANAWSVLGYDAQSIGRGGAMSGGAEGPAAMFYNPAGMVKPTGSRYSVTYLHGQPQLDLEPAANPERLDFAAFAPQSDPEIATACGTLEPDDRCVRDYRRYNEYLSRAARVTAAYDELNEAQRADARRPKHIDGLTLGFTRRLDELAAVMPIAVGVSVFLPLDPWPYLVDMRLKGPTSPQFIQFDELPHRALVNLGLAAEPLPNLRLGLVIDIFSNVEADFDANVLLPTELRLGSIFAPEINANDVAVVPAGRLHAKLTATPRVGLQYSAGEHWDMGLSFRAEQRMDIDLQAELLMASPLGNERVPLEITNSLRFVPRQLSGGVAWQAHRTVRLFADLSWRQWSRYRPEFAVEGRIAGNDLSASACQIVQAFADLEQILNVADDVIGIGPDNICSLIEEQIDEEIEFAVWEASADGLRDTLNPALGVAVSPSWWTVAGGYRFEPNPLPEQHGAFNLLGADTHIVAGSIEARVNDWLSVAFAAQAHLLRQTTVRKTAAAVDEDSGGADVYPDLDDEPQNGANGAFQTSDATLDALVDYVDGAQRLNPLYPEATVGGAYLSGGLQIMAAF